MYVFPSLRGRSARFWLSAAFCTAALFVALLWLSAGLVPLKAPLSDWDFSTLITDRSGRILRLSLTKDEKYRLRLPLSKLPAWALDKIIAYEDRWFFQHPGVNVFALLRSAGSMLLGGRRMGGSTLTMQTVRLAYRLKTSTVLGKLKQIFLALCLERHYSKSEILEAYFSLAPYGGNVEGLAAAARLYFHKSAEQLSQDEAWALMLVPQNPVLRRPDEKNPHFQAARLRQLRRLGSEEQPAPLKIFGLADLPFKAPHLTEELLARRAKEPGASDTIVTTLDWDQQELLEGILGRYLARNKAWGITNASLLLVHYPSLSVRALIGSACFTDHSIEGQIDGTKVRRSPGSTLKPFIYALALEQGLIHPMSLLYDTPRSFRGYDPENFDHTFRGPLPAWQALVQSRNVPAISLAQRLKHPDLYSFLKSAHVSFQKSAEHYGLALVLGGAEVTMRELATLYSMLGNRGIVKELRFEMGRESQEWGGQSLLTPEAAFVTLAMLEEAQSEWLVSRRGERIPLRLKTGTSNGFRDAWTCGFVGPYVLVVWIGNFDNSSNPLFVGGRVARPLFEELARALAWREALHDSLHEPWDGLNVEKIPVCRATGDLDTSLCPDRTETWFIPGVSPFRSSGVYRRIEINHETGLRACLPEQGKTEQVVWEFWPSDLASMFQQAGLPKAPPPPFEQMCREREEEGERPRIMSPKAGLTYYASLSQAERAKIVLSAHGGAGVKSFTWFVDGQYVGESLPGAHLTQTLAPGLHHLFVRDDKDRVSVQNVRVLAAP